MDICSELGRNLLKLYFSCIDKGSDILEKLRQHREVEGGVRHHYSCNASLSFSPSSFNVESEIIRPNAHNMEKGHFSGGGERGATRASQKP